MILGFKPSDGQNDAYLFGKVAGPDGTPHDRKFIRVVAGLILPHLERQPAAVVVIGELYRSFESPDLTALGACVDQWPVVQTALLQLYQDLKFSHIITDSERSKEELWRIQELRRAMRYAAPAQALGEVGRQNVTGMKQAERFRYDMVEERFRADPEQAAKAIQCAVGWMLENRAFYLPSRGKRDYGMQGIIGVTGLD